MKCSICYEICSDVETSLNHLKTQHSRVEYLQCATNGFVFVDQCRKCGLAGVARKHYGPRGAVDCEKQKLELKALGIKPLIPWTIQALTRERISTHSQIERMRETLNCPICGITCKKPNGASDKIQQHILSKHQLAIYKCAECAYKCSWPKELQEHCLKEHQRQITIAEASGELHAEALRNENLATEIEHYILGADKENAPGMHINVESAVTVNQSVGQSSDDNTDPSRISLVILQKRDNLKRDHNTAEDGSETPSKKAKLDEYDPDLDDEDLMNEPEVPDKIYLEPIVQDTTPRTRRQLETPPNGRDKIECPFCRRMCIRRGIVQHVSHSHPDQYKKFRRSAAYTKILPLFCASCKMRFAGNESFRKHFQDSSCKKPDKTAENQLSKEQEAKYKCPSGCNFFGPLRLMLTHMYQHPEANVKLRLRKSKLLPVKCEECSFHYTTRASLSKHIEKKRCIKNKEHVRYANQKMTRRQELKLKKESPPLADNQPHEQQKTGERIDIEVIKSGEALFLRCPFDCGKLYTSKDKLIKHVVESHNVEVEQEKTQVPEQVNVGSLVRSLFRTEGNEIMCPIENCRFVVPSDQYSRLAAHCRKNHFRYEYLIFRSTPTNEAPYLCQNCKWSFTKQAITNHFQREGRTVCVKNKKMLDEVMQLDKVPKLYFGDKRLLDPSKPHPLSPVQKRINEEEIMVNTPKALELIVKDDNLKPKTPVSEVTDIENKENSNVGPLQQILNESKESNESTQDEVLENNVSGNNDQHDDNDENKNENVEDQIEIESFEKVQKETETLGKEQTEEKDKSSEKEDFPETDSIDKLEDDSTTEKDPITEQLKKVHINLNTTVEVKKPVENIIMSEPEDDLLSKTLDDLIGPPEIESDVLEALDLALPNEHSEHPIIKVESTLDDTFHETEDTIEEIPLDDHDEEDEDDAPIDQLLMRSSAQATIESFPINFDRPFDQLIEFLLRSLNSNPPVFKFSCPYCSFQTVRLTDLNEHIKHSHTTSQYIRYLSSCRYSQYQCGKCGIRSNSKTWMTMHSSQDQKSACQKFYFFRTNFKIGTELQNTLIISQSSHLPHERIYKCPECPKHFKTQIGGMLDHIAFCKGIESYLNMRRNGTPDLKIKCPKCEWYFDSLTGHSTIDCQLYQAISAKRTTSIPKPTTSVIGVKCPLCKKDCANVFELLNHVSLAHPDYNTVFRLRKSDLLPYKCPVCSFHFPTLNLLQNHRKLPGECQRNLNERQRLIHGLDLSSQRGTNSPILNGGRDSRLSFNSDQNDSAYHPSPADVFHHYSPQPKKMIPFQQLNQQQPTMSLPPQIAPPSTQMIQGQYFGNQQAFYQSVLQMPKKPHLDNYSTQFQHHQLMPQKSFIDMNKDRFLVQVAQPNHFEPGTISTCSYCFLIMKSKDDIQRHAHHHQECMIAAQTTLSKNVLPCLYCGAQFTNPSSARLQQHIQQHHPHVYEQFRRTLSIALPYRCPKCLLCFSDFNVLQVHQKSGQCHPHQ